MRNFNSNTSIVMTVILVYRVALHLSIQITKSMKIRRQNKRIEKDNPYKNHGYSKVVLYYFESYNLITSIFLIFFLFHINIIFHKK